MIHTKNPFESKSKSSKNRTKRLEHERKMAFESLPPHISENMTEEEKELFLYAEEWPESMFKKFDEFIVS